MKRFILTGAPGSGKTVLLRQLELQGFEVVEEAATDVVALWQARGIAEPWKERSFVRAVVELQRSRQERGSSEQVQFYDRSPVCTLALARYLGVGLDEALRCEIERICRERVYETRIFFVRNLGFVEPTQARRISFEESLRFEKLHEEAYREYGFERVYIPAGTVDERIAAIRTAIPTAT